MSLKIKPPRDAKNGANTKDSTAMSLMRILNEGPKYPRLDFQFMSPVSHSYSYNFI